MKRRSVVSASVAFALVFAVSSAQAGYVKNNPLNATDPTGQDELVVYRPLKPTEPLSEERHTAKYVGNNQAGWTYLSKDGVKGNPGAPFGPAASTEVSGIKNLDAAKADAASRGYNEGFIHSESPLNDIANIKATEAALKTDYNLICANCGQAVTAGDKAGGIPTDNSAYPGPRGAELYRQSKQGQSDGWRSVVIPPPPPPPTSTPQQH